MFFPRPFILREFRLNNHDDEDIGTWTSSFLDSFLKYFKLSCMVSVYLLSWSSSAAFFSSSLWLINILYKQAEKKGKKENRILLYNNNVSLQEKRYCETLVIDVLFFLL